jgi:hypothetical protein
MAELDSGFCNGSALAIAVGFRCHKDSIVYVVLDGDLSAPRVIEHRQTPMPRGDRPDQLVWLRQEVQEIVQRSRPSTVAFKAAEPVARTKDLGRAEVEGVLQEAVRTLDLLPLRRVKSQIKADLDFARPARYLSTLLTGELARLPTNRAEAALVALAALANA